MIGADTSPSEGEVVVSAAGIFFGFLPVIKANFMTPC